MGTRDFTTEDERKTRRERVAQVGDLAYGGSWQTPLAAALGIPRARVAQWMLEPSAEKEKNVPAKPVPAWVMAALPAIARAAAARLRSDADKLDALAAEMGPLADDGAPPAADGEPDAQGKPPQESGSGAAQADGEFDMERLAEIACSVPSPYAKAPEPVPERTGWRTDFADARIQRWMPPVKLSPEVPDERAFLN